MNQFENYSYNSKIWKVILILSLSIVTLGIMVSLLWIPNYKLLVKIFETDQIQNNRMLKVKEAQEIFKNNNFTFNTSYIEIDRNDTNKIRIYKSINNDFNIELNWWNHKPSTNRYASLSKDDILDVIMMFYKNGSSSIRANYEKRRIN